MLTSLPQPDSLPQTPPLSMLPVADHVSGI